MTKISRLDLTASVEDYLKAVYHLSSDGPASTNAIAEALNLSAPSVSGMVKRLAEQGLLEHVPYKGVKLTRAGRKGALRMLRRHRLIEAYLVEKLGYSWDTVHDEAERLEHAVSDDLVDRMAAALGNPAFDPHGDPIPSPDLTIPEMDDVELRDAAHHGRVVVTRVSDRSAEIVRLLVASGVVPGVELCGISMMKDNNSVIVEMCGGASVAISPESAEAIRVRPLD